MFNTTNSLSMLNVVTILGDANFQFNLLLGQLIPLFYTFVLMYKLVVFAESLLSIMKTTIALKK